MVPRMARRRVLVVDDNAFERRILAAALASAFDVVQARDGVDGVRILATSLEFACVVTADQMPGCTGLDLVDFVRRTPSRDTVPVLVVTSGASSPASRQIAGLRAGASAFMNKATAPGHLLQMVETIVRMAKRRPVRR
jgi:two-component system chemotaxis response regulator CheY